MENQKRLTTNGLSLQHSIYLVTSLGMVGISIYLTQHYFQTFFPEGIQESGLCDINAFWSCDMATKSLAGSLFHIPTAWFGLVIGLLGLAGAIFPSLEMEKTNKTLIYLNFIGCCVLFIYSLVFLGGLCPFCTVYYILSGVCVYLFWEHSDVSLAPSPKLLALWLVVAVAGSMYLRSEFMHRMKTQDSLSAQYITQFFNIPVEGDPIVNSKFLIHKSSSASFAETPIRVSMFSDFQCSHCKVVSDAMPDLIKEFGDKISIQYYFFPLDNSCNAEMKRQIHSFACAAAYIAACDTTKFAEVHDAIFKSQAVLSNDILSSIEKDYGLSGCRENQKVKDAVQETLEAGQQSGVDSTPTLIINGRKVKAAIASTHLIAILKEILKRDGK
jgi:protein-disulfide isomerase